MKYLQICIRIIKYFAIYYTNILIKNLRKQRHFVEAFKNVCIAGNHSRNMILRHY